MQPIEPAAGVDTPATRTAFVMLYVQPLLMVVFRLDTGGPAVWSANALPPWIEFPVIACAAQLLSPQETGRVAV